MPVKDKEKRKEICRRYWLNNKEKALKATRKWQNEHAERCRENKRNWKKRNQDKVKEEYKRWLAKDPDVKKEMLRRYARDRRKTIKGNLTNRISPLMSRSLKDGKCGKHWEVLVGYTVNDLKEHIEKQFIDGMSWSNRKDWHIDHIIPISAFNYNTPDDIDFKKCWSLNNLRPLWAVKNISKKNKLTKPHQPSLLIAAKGGQHA